jgi:hypothetical protein
MGMKHKLKFFEKKNQNGPHKKKQIFYSPNSQHFFSKISWIGPLLIGLIDSKGIDVAQPIWP